MAARHRMNMAEGGRNMTNDDNGRKAALRPTVAAGFARGLIAFAASRGVSDDALHRLSDIAPQDLEDLDSRIPFAKYVALMRAAKALSGDPAFALHFGEAVSIDEMSIACMIGRAAETLLDGFRHVNRYNRLILEVDLAGPDRFRLRHVNGEVWMVDTRSDPNDFPELTESTFARMVCQSRRLYPDRKFVSGLRVTHKEPSYRTAYEHIFQVPIVFGADCNALVTDGSWMSENSRMGARYVFGVLSSHAEHLLERLEKAHSLREQVERVLMPVLHTGEIGAEAIAARLGMAQHTLYRRLKDEGLTFRKVVNDLRRQLAIHYLQGGKASVKETAYLVGFSDPASFSRAFKRWTGRNPRAAWSKPETPLEPDPNSTA